MKPTLPTPRQPGAPYTKHWLKNLNPRDPEALIRALVCVAEHLDRVDRGLAEVQAYVEAIDFNANGPR